MAQRANPPPEYDHAVLDQLCGRVTRAVLAAAGDSCNLRGVDEVAEQLDALDDVRVDRWERADDQVDDRDFLDLALESSQNAGKVFLITTRNGFVPEAMAGSWEHRDQPAQDRTVVLQYKR